MYVGFIGYMGDIGVIRVLSIGICKDVRVLGCGLKDLEFN